MWFEPTAPLYEDWLQFELRDSDRWISDIYVAPSQRGRSLANHLGHWGRANLPEDVTAVIGVTNALNKGSLRAGQKAGYDVIPMTYGRILGLTAVKLPGRTWFGRPGRRRPFRVRVAEVAPPHDAAIPEQPPTSPAD